MQFDNQTAGIDPAIVIKVRKLLNRAKDAASTQGEAEMAQAAAQRLMLDHNISLAMVQASTSTSTAKRRKDKVENVGRYAWQRDLMSSIATANFCLVSTPERCVYDSLGRPRWVRDGLELFGREENVVSASVMFDYLRKTIDRLARDYVGGDAKLNMSKQATSFKEGCGARLAQRVRTIHREAMDVERGKAPAGDGRSLALMDDWSQREADENEDFRCGFAAGTTARRRYVSEVSDNAWRLASAALQPLKDVTDKAMLTQVAMDAISALMDATGLEGEERASVIKSAVTWHVEGHIRAANDRANPKKEKAARGRSYRSYGRAAKPRDWNAQRAGSRAADDVSLDRQVAERAASLKLKGGR
jgi:hypothetical protein